LHDARTLGEDFAVAGDLQNHVANGSPGAAHAVLWVVGGQHGRGFRKAVALVDGNANGPEKLGEILCQRRTARTNETNMAARAGADLAIHQSIRESPLQLKAPTDGLLAAAPSAGARRNAHGPVEDLALQPDAAAPLLHDAGVDFLEDAGNRAHDRGLHL